MRLIDADELREDWLQNGENEYVYDANAFLESIDDAPTVDAVEVVRCKDCKRSFIYNPKNEGIVYCAIHGMSKNGNGFCEEGVPKEGN